MSTEREEEIPDYWKWFIGCSLRNADEPVPSLEAALERDGRLPPDPYPVTDFETFVHEYWPDKRVEENPMTVLFDTDQWDSAYAFYHSERHIRQFLLTTGPGVVHEAVAYMDRMFEPEFTDRFDDARNYSMLLVLGGIRWLGMHGVALVGHWLRGPDDSSTSYAYDCVNHELFRFPEREGEWREVMKGHTSDDLIEGFINRIRRDRMIALTTGHHDDDFCMFHIH